MRALNSLRAAVLGSDTALAITDQASASVAAAQAAKRTDAEKRFNKLRKTYREEISYRVKSSAGTDGRLWDTPHPHASAQQISQKATTRDGGRLACGITLVLFGAMFLFFFNLAGAPEVLLLVMGAVAATGLAITAWDTRWRWALRSVETNLRLSWKAYNFNKEFLDHFKATARLKPTDAVSEGLVEAYNDWNDLLLTIHKLERAGFGDTAQAHETYAVMADLFAEVRATRTILEERYAVVELADSKGVDMTVLDRIRERRSLAAPASEVAEETVWLTGYLEELDKGTLNPRDH